MTEEEIIEIPIVHVSPICNVIVLAIFVAWCLYVIHELTK